MKVKNISTETQAIVGVGEVKSGETITVPDGFNNPNFEVVKSGTQQPEQPKRETKKETNK